MAAEPEKPAEGAETKGAGGGKGGFIVALLLLAVVGAGAGAGFSLMFLRTTAPAAEQASAAIAEPAGKKPEAGNVGVKAGDTSKSGAKPEGDARKEQVAGLAYRIQDTGADGAILVSPLGVQKGAALVAARENIHIVQLDGESSTADYLMKFLEKTMIGASLEMNAEASISFSAEVIRSKNP